MGPSSRVYDSCIHLSGAEDVGFVDKYGPVSCLQRKLLPLSRRYPQQTTVDVTYMEYLLQRYAMVVDW